MFDIRNKTSTNIMNSPITDMAWAERAISIPVNTREERISWTALCPKTMAMGCRMIPRQQQRSPHSEQANATHDSLQIVPCFNATGGRLRFLTVMTLQALQ